PPLLSFPTRRSSDLGFAGGVQNGSNRPSAAVRLWHTGGNANVFVSTPHKERRCHPFAVFLADCVDHIEIIVDFARAEIQSGGILDRKSTRLNSSHLG